MPMPNFGCHMIEKRKYFGKMFWKQKDGYWANNMPIHAQRWVWINHRGAIPEGMDIHHKDGNKGNNEIENLEMLDRSEHLKRHWQEGRFDLEKRRIQLTEARKWLKTPEGRKRQSEDAIQAWKERPNIEITCKNCGKKINAIFKRAQFCSDPCNYQFRRKQKGDRVQNPRKKSVKICRFCESEFLAAMPYAMYCSTKCRKRMSGGRKYLQ